MKAAHTVLEAAVVEVVAAPQGWYLVDEPVVGQQVGTDWGVGAEVGLGPNAGVELEPSAEVGPGCDPAWEAEAHATAHYQGEGEGPERETVRERKMSD